MALAQAALCWSGCSDEAHLGGWRLSAAGSSQGCWEAPGQLIVAPVQELGQTKVGQRGVELVTVKQQAAAQQEAHHGHHAAARASHCPREGQYHHARAGQEQQCHQGCVKA